MKSYNSYSVFLVDSVMPNIPTVIIKKYLKYLKRTDYRQLNTFEDRNIVLIL